MSTLLEEPRTQSSHDDLLGEWAATYDRPEDVPELGWLVRVRSSEPRIDERSIPAGTRFVKRMLDIFVAVTLLVLLAPLLLVVAVLVKLTSRGPIIYSQERVGLNLRRGDRREDWQPTNRERRARDRRANHSFGQRFTVYKIRTMRIDAEKNGAQFSKKGDSRITPIGRILRKTRIDELPQLWNVLRGEMAIVGPRPERPEFVERFSREIPHYTERLRLRPGLTGIAQVVNGYDNDLVGFQRRVLLDRLYLQNDCVENDLRILVRTVRVVATGDGAM